MLMMYRRHVKTCKFKGRLRHDARARNCQCPIWVQGGFRGSKPVRTSLKLTSWEAATDLVRAWTTAGRIGGDDITTASPIPKAVDRYMEDLAARNMSPATNTKYKVLLRDRLLPWCASEGYTMLTQLGTDELTQFRSSWPDAPRTARQNTMRLRSFMDFCLVRDWIKKNPARELSRLKVSYAPTLPFEPVEIDRILAACDDYNGNSVRMRALVMLMRYSGLAIRDAVTCRRDQINDAGELNLYRAKTGQHVFVPLAPAVLDALKAVQNPNPDFFFWSGTGRPETAAGLYRRSLATIFLKANVANGHPHRFRDTFAVELLKAGVGVSSVSMLLGHSSTKTTEQSYMPWVKERQDRLTAEVRKIW